MVFATITSIPIGSMYGIFTYIWLIFMVDVGKYTIHASSGIEPLSLDGTLVIRCFFVQPSSWTEYDTFFRTTLSFDRISVRVLSKIGRNRTIMTKPQWFLYECMYMQFSR